MYNQHTREMATTRHRSLVEKDGRKACIEDKGLASIHTKREEKIRKNLIFSSLKNQRIRAHRASSNPKRLFRTQ